MVRLGWLSVAGAGMSELLECFELLMDFVASYSIFLGGHADDFIVFFAFLILMLSYHRLEACNMDFVAHLYL